MTPHLMGAVGTRAARPTGPPPSLPSTSTLRLPSSPRASPSCAAIDPPPATKLPFPPSQTDTPHTKPRTRNLPPNMRRKIINSLYHPPPTEAGMSVLYQPHQSTPASPGLPGTLVLIGRPRLPCQVEAQILPRIATKTFQARLKSRQATTAFLATKFTRELPVTQDLHHGQKRSLKSQLTDMR